MPKIKTNKGAAKRVKRTAGGAVVRRKAYASHLMSKKTRKRKRGLKQPTLLSRADRKKITRLAPYL